MRPHLPALVAGALLAGAAPLLHGAPAPASALDAPSVSVGGGAEMYPAYSPGISRYAVHPAPDGSVRVDVGGAVPVWFDGVPDADGSAVFSDVTPGQEISVIVGTGADRLVHALYVLPPGFPTLASESTGAPLAPGDLALTLDRYDGASPHFEAVVDRRGVPVYTRSHRDRVLDLKLAADGHLTVHRPTTTPGRTGGALVELDEQFREVRRLETTGLVDTDDHDSLLLPDGSRWMVAYEPNAATGLIDAVIQHLDPDGSVVWQWSSAPYADETVVPGDADYAHLNSIDVQPDGDVLASFRHLSSVFLIRPGSGPDEVVWKLGGRDSTFAFPPLPGGAPDNGPCAQHSATVLPNGNVLVFDNGSSTFFGRPLCVDQQDPQRGSVQRPTTRVVEFALADGTATPVRTYGDTSRFAWFMGSAARTTTGTTLIGWSAAQDSIATETDAAGLTTWRLADTRAVVDGVRLNAFISYRVALVPSRDGFDPEVRLDGPADGVTVVQGDDVPVGFSCTDRGGSTLQSCDGPAGRRLDTSTPGVRTWSVTARDGAARTTTRTRTYTVVAAPTDPTTAPTTPATTVPPTAPTVAPTAPPALRPATPDLALRVRGPATGRVSVRTQPGRVVRAVLRVRNTGETAGRFVVRGPASVSSGEVRVSYVHRGRVRTGAVAGRGWRTPVVEPGGSLRVLLRTRVAATADVGTRRVVVSAGSAGSASAGRDRALLLLRVSRGRAGV